MLRRIAAYLTLLLGYGIFLCLMSAAKNWSLLETLFAASLTGMIGYVGLAVVAVVLFFWLLRRIF